MQQFISKLESNDKELANAQATLDTLLEQHPLIQQAMDQITMLEEERDGIIKESKELALETFKKNPDTATVNNY